MNESSNQLLKSKNLPSLESCLAGDAQTSEAHGMCDDLDEINPRDGLLRATSQSTSLASP